MQALEIFFDKLFFEYLNTNALKVINCLSMFQNPDPLLLIQKTKVNLYYGGVVFHLESINAMLNVWMNPFPAQAPRVLVSYLFQTKEDLKIRMSSQISNLTECLSEINFQHSKKYYVQTKNIQYHESWHSYSGVIQLLVCFALHNPKCVSIWWEQELQSLEV